MPNSMKVITIICFFCIPIFAIPLKEATDASLKHHDGRIVGGRPAQEKQFPWQVAIYADTANATFFCGGALIHVQWVLTSGHCVDRATIFTIHLGSNHLGANDPNRVQQTTVTWVEHPTYNPRTLENDIGLIKLYRPVELNDYIQVLPLSPDYIGRGVSTLVSGWGATGDWDGAVPELNFVELTTITNIECQAIYGQIIYDGMICAVGRNIEGTCNGDSGSPLVTLNSSGQYVHIGIVSWTSSDGCETDHPSGYTRTFIYERWIHNIINNS